MVMNVAVYLSCLDDFGGGIPTVNCVLLFPGVEEKKGMGQLLGDLGPLDDIQRGMGQRAWVYMQAKKCMENCTLFFPHMCVGGGDVRLYIAFSVLGVAGVPFFRHSS